MAEPEWKQKFREIGQKGEEEVTEVTEGGIKKETSTPRRDASTPVSKPAGYKSPAKPAETMSDDKKEDAEVPLEAGDDEDAAAMFAAAGESESAVEEEVVEEEVVEEEVVEEEVVEEEVVEDEEEVKEVIDLTAVEEPEDPAFDPEDPEAQKELLNDVPPNKRSAMKCFLPFLCFAILAGVGIATGYFVFGRETITAAPTKAPISYIDFDENAPPENADTSAFDAYTGQCDLSRLKQPHFMDQCNCGSTPTVVVKEDVLARYMKYVPFAEKIFPDWSEDPSSCSPRNQALLWLASGLNNGGEMSDEYRQDRYLMAAFYIAQGGPKWEKSTNWLTTMDVCDWEGTFCDDDGFVYALDLSANGLEGDLSDMFTYLNGIMYVSFSDNAIAGTIPFRVLNSATLKTIDLSGNDLFGEMPTIASEIPLEILLLQSNNLSGGIYGSIDQATSLVKLDLSSNSLNGELPSSLFGLPLEELSLESNVLSGEIPGDIGLLTSLTSLKMGSNKFSGDLPESIGDLSSLVVLTLNDLPELSGILPAKFGQTLKNLVTFVLSGTAVGGNIPTTFGGLTSLEVLDLSVNEIDGALPSQLGLLTSLEKLWLNDNDISSEIPPEMGNMSALAELKLASNDIVGEIPSEFGQLAKLEVLTLEDNMMTGRAPDEVCALRDAELILFTVECVARDGEVDAFGIVCPIPSCCTKCFE